MASRYWVGGTGTWSAAGTGNWSATSGGASGASVPGSSDDVFFDANSGSGTCTMSASAGIASISFAGSAITTFAQGTNTITVLGSGGVTLNAGVTHTGSGVIALNSAGATVSMNFNGAGATIAVEIRVAESGGGTTTVTLTGAVTTTNSNGVRVNSTSGTSVLDTAGYAVTAPIMLVDTGDTLTLGSSTVTITGTGTCWNMHASATFNADTSTIILNNASSSTKTFAGGGKTYATVQFAGAGTGRFDITGSNTFGTFDIATPPHEVRFTAGTTQTITTSFDGASGSSGNLNTLRSSSNGSAWNISKTSGTVTVEYVSLRDSVAAGGAEFLAPRSTNAGGNSGWEFDAVGFFGFGHSIPFA